MQCSTVARVEWFYGHHITPKYKESTNVFDNFCVLSNEEHIMLRSSRPEELYKCFPKRETRIKPLIENL